VRYLLLLLLLLLLLSLLTRFMQRAENTIIKKDRDHLAAMQQAQDKEKALNERIEQLRQVRSSAPSLVLALS